MARIPAAEVDVTPALVRALLAEQHPDLAALPITPFAHGWDNVMLRLGDDLLVRMPRRAIAAGLVEHEQTWLPLLATQLPTAVPAPVRVGRPGLGYPWAWTVLAWVPGVPLSELPVGGRERVAASLAAVLTALHVPAPDAVRANPARGNSLCDRADVVAERAERHLGDDAPAVLAAWRRAVDDPPPPGPRLWVHGDLHPLNVLTADGDLVALIDWGDLTAGDPACDLAIAWLGLDPAAAATLRTRYDRAARHDLDLEALWQRGWAWAVHLSLLLLDSSDDHRGLAAIGAHGVSRVREAAVPRHGS